MVKLSADHTRSRAAYVPLHRAITAAFHHGTRLHDDLQHSRSVAFFPGRHPITFAWHYLHASAMSKLTESHVSARERADAAIRKFYEAEAVCADANQRLCDGFNRPALAPHMRLLARARRIVAEVLGKCDLELLPRACAFSSGASTEANRTRSMIQVKWDEASQITQGALPYWLAYVKWNGCEGVSRPVTIVAGNEVFTVPKNFERDRVCAKEPPLNMFLQKGLGTMIRNRLQRVGLLHPSAQEYHGALAAAASSTGDLATIDLKAASDTVSLAVCELLLPDDWLQVILDLRSPVGLVPNGGPILYEKVSSMGNGFTFELETLIFYALVRAVCGKDALVTVYGDDIICPSHSAAACIDLLAVCGFQTNSDKTFTTGPFRESCGSHYYAGVNVKPFYIRSYPSDWPSVMNLHNDILSWCERTGLRPKCFLTILAECRRLIPRKYWGPAGTAGCLWSNWDEATPRFVRGSRRLNEPAYHHWRVATVRYKSQIQEHEYLVGGLLHALSGVAPPSVLSQSRRCAPKYWARHLTSISDVKSSEIVYASREVVTGWTAVDVKQLWYAFGRSRPFALGITVR